MEYMKPNGEEEEEELLYITITFEEKALKIILSTVSVFFLMLVQNMYY